MHSAGHRERQVLLAGDMSFENVLHRKSAGTDSSFRAMLKKDREAQKAAADEYFQHWDNKDAKSETEAIRAARMAEYDNITRQYYNLATDFYEYGWCQSFHFCRFGANEPFQQAIARHEHYLAHVTGIKKGMRVLDVGCGVGGPAREIAKFTGANITGITINEYQVQRARRYAVRDGLEKQLQFVQGDFMKMPFEDGTFDAIYAIEATVHAPSLKDIYSEIYRVLKPGGTFGVYEWVMTDAYDNDNLHHRKIRLDIEQGDAITNMVKAEVALDAIRAAGFELVETEDLANRVEDHRPWYFPLDGANWRSAPTWGDMLTMLPMTQFGRFFFHNFMGALEVFRLAPPGTKKTGDSLSKAGNALALGGKEKLFTPMFLMVGKKAAN